MRLINYNNLGNYEFSLLFENNKEIKVNLAELISSKISLEELNTVRLDKEWGCLEFKNGMIDIEPKTLYRFCSQLIV